jgi:hypothetical protein
MKTLKQLCKPRQSVFDRNRRDVVLDLTDLIEDRIRPVEFFEENYLTEGMKRLLREAFRRFEGKSSQGVFVLTQAMGGGKTHNMIALGLLAKHPELRKQVMSDLYQAKDLAEVRAVAFTGRESDAPFGIWGAIAEQLGKKEVFKDYYSPLSAPGLTAWVNLLKGEPTLILLDELPPTLRTPGRDPSATPTFPGSRQPRYPTCWWRSGRTSFRTCAWLFRTSKPPTKVGVSKSSKPWKTSGARRGVAR